VETGIMAMLQCSDIEQAINMKLILYMFEQLSSLKINFHKNEIFYFSKAKEENLYTQLFGCELGSYPCQYLGLLMHYKKLNNKDWKKHTGKI
jgi:hypothetical protein